MTNPSESVEIACPYCGETLLIDVDQSAGRQQYIEDCQVCCQPIQLRVSQNPDGLPAVEARREDE